MKKYVLLTKLGIIFGNVLSAVAGFFLASKGRFPLTLFLPMLAGISLVIAGACVFNNIIDIGLDEKMERTMKRSLPDKKIKPGSALIIGLVLLVFGMLILLGFVNILTAAAGATGFVFYLVFYSLGKRRSVYGTLIGSVAGSMPLIGGYLAYAGRIDIAAILLFVTFSLWQMPHFYSIALYHLNDYRAAGLPMLPVVKGVRTTKIRIMFYISAFIIASIILTIMGITGLIYLLFSVGFGLFWLLSGLKNFGDSDYVSWGRYMFRISLLVLFVFCLGLIL